LGDTPKPSAGKYPCTLLGFRIWRLPELARVLTHLHTPLGFGISNFAGANPATVPPILRLQVREEKSNLRPGVLLRVGPVDQVLPDV